MPVPVADGGLCSDVSLSASDGLCTDVTAPVVADWLCSVASPLWVQSLGEDVAEVLDDGREALEDSSDGGALSGMVIGV